MRTELVGISIRGGGSFAIPNRIVTDYLPRIGPFAFSLLAMLTCYANAGAKEYLTHHLAKGLDVSERTIQRELSRLVQAGLLKIVMRPGYTNSYEINFSPEPAKEQGGDTGVGGDTAVTGDKIPLPSPSATPLSLSLPLGSFPELRETTPVPVAGDQPDTASPESGKTYDGPSPEALMDLWNERSHPALPRVKIMTKTRRVWAVARLRENPDFSFWVDVINRVNRSPLLTGQSNGPGHNNFRASFDWILNVNNLAKIVEGNYDPTRRR